LTLEHEMKAPQTLEIDKDGLLRDSGGKYHTDFVDSCVTAEMVFPKISVIQLRLYEQTDLAHGRKSGAGDLVAMEDAHQFRMSVRTARAVAAQLLALADHLEGKNAPRQ
jgi:hypothetical protein